MELLSQYIDAKSKLDRYKKLEAELRIKLLNHLFPTAVEGTYNTFINSVKIKGKFGVNINLNQQAYNELSAQMSDDELECINLKPNLSIAKYKQLKDKSTLEQCISVSPAMPTIEIVNEDI